MSERDLDPAAVLADIVRQMAAHWGLWLAESVHHLGLDAALDAEAEAGDRFFSILAGKLGRAMGRDANGLLAGVDPAVAEAVAQALRTAWLAADGVWFQAVEAGAGMDAAKRVNDTCWTRFASLEARRAKALLGLPEAGGLPALKRALAVRMYGRLNRWEFVAETEDTLVFRMTECRVQSARKRRGLPDYPCKSGGVAEYTGFSREIDSRILCQCLGCPPDPHPDEWACAWLFTLPAEQG